MTDSKHVMTKHDKMWHESIQVLSTPILPTIIIFRLWEK